MNAPATGLLTGTLVLRVLSGRLKGAEYRLPQGKFVRVGHSFDHDVVLRDPSTRGLSFALAIDGSLANVRMEGGEAILLGRPLAPGETAHLPAFVPLSVGSFAVAVGEAGSERWQEVEQLSLQVAPVAPPPEAAGTRAALTERLATRLHPLRTLMPERGDWPAFGALAAGALLIAAVAAPALDWAERQWNGPANAQAVLRDAGFAGLSVMEGGAQGPLISGIVRDDAELARLRAVVTDRIGQASIDVDTMEAMAAAATDMLRAQGVDAEARAMRGQALLVESEYLPPDRQSELAALIRRDLPGVARVAFRIENGRGDRDLQYFFSSGPWGLATFVDGDPGYIVTADGTRWFAGAQLPTGHRITAIGNGRVSMERAGQIEELVLGPPSAPATSPGTPSPVAGPITERSAS